MKRSSGFPYIVAACGLGVLGHIRTAEAIPAFASQTGQPCTACHVGAFGPQLTPFGRAFKMGGYTQDGGEGLAAKIPLSAMILSSFNNSSTAWPSGSQPTEYGTNNNFAIDQVSLFLGGRITDWAGGFVQATYSGLQHSYHLDQVDVRPFTKAFDLHGSELRVGITVNNNPTVQDTFNTTFAWGYPYVFSGLTPAPNAAALPILVGGFANNAVGLTAYAWYDRSLYLEGGFYTTMNSALASRLGESYGPGATPGLAPYLRAAYEWNWNGQAAHVGGLFMAANVNPTTGAQSTDGSMGQDSYVDYGFDGGYQFYGDGTHTVSLYGIYVHEDRTLNGTFNAVNGSAAGSKSSVDHFRTEVSYWYQNTYGVTVAYQGIWGKANPAVFSDGNPVTNSANGKPTTDLFIFEADWVPFGKQDSWAAPFMNMKVGLQYTMYTMFNGASANYDGYGRNASANNTLYAYVWLMF